ncbi:hypothetical protein F7Q99_38270 [Streptomyces kaniharaensis]|uniref:Uncharacterized protein n=1 Tax=Streptomyces kaniharaensis TaxID=212423 RepID=A0A6N7L2Q0_9ACTN|nr:hypothetical protein [Streptomyces kaniharaensis]MQS17881.1 hypothetical protein [Streptomyces kaniharaensis]
MFAIERDARIAVLRKTHYERSQTLVNVPVGTRSHGRLLVECEDISDEIDRLKRCINIPRSVAMTVPVLLAVLVLALVS